MRKAPDALANKVAKSRAATATREAAVTDFILFLTANAMQLRFLREEAAWLAIARAIIAHYSLRWNSDAMGASREIAGL